MEKEILEWNKLIASFVDEVYKTQMGNIVNFINKPTLFETSNSFEVSELLYHTSWDWLMPVVERIEKECKALVNINSVSCEIKTIPFHIEIIDNNVTKNHSKYSIYRESNSKIESTWLCVVDFIHFYNTQSK